MPSAAESDNKILRDVFEKGDIWFRTGDRCATTRPGHETEQALLDAAERLLVEVGRGRDHDAAGRRGGRREPRPRPLLLRLGGAAARARARALHRAADRAAAADVRGGHAVSREVADGDGLPRRGSSVPEDLVRAAGAVLEPARAPRAARTGARRVARRPERGVCARPRRARARRCRSRRWSRSCYTFNEGIMLERLSGIETEHRELLDVDRRAGSRGGRDDRRAGAPDRARADARALPGRGGLRRARRRPDLLRGLRLGRADGLARCRRGRSSTRATGRCRSPTSRGIAAC